MRNLSIALATAVGLLCTGQSAAFHGLTRSNTRYLKMSAVESTEDMGVASLSSLLKRDRYIASNRFRVRKGKEAKFEQRWATRKSRLATLEGFKYFHLMRRVRLSEDEAPISAEDFNYVSFTVWEEKKHFNAWRQGDAFKEAHGGTSITAFLGAMVSSLRVLKGPPRPAFYDGLLQQSIVPETVPETMGGWRSVDADGVNPLPEEAFVACNQFFVPTENGVAFEQRFASRVSRLKECDGFVSFSLLRRDGKAKGHGVVPVEGGEPTYMTCTIWSDRAAFEAWKAGQAFKNAHGDGQASGKPSGVASGDSNNGASSNSKNSEGGPPAPLWNGRPVPIFYEATLVISSAAGA